MLINYAVWSRKEKEASAKETQDGRKGWKLKWDAEKVVGRQQAPHILIHASPRVMHTSVTHVYLKVHVLMHIKMRQLYILIIHK